MAKTFFIYTFGCRLNQAESALIRAKLLSQGWQEAPLEIASRIIINSCAVTQKASKEVAQYVRHCRRLNPQAKIWLMGCWVDAQKVAAAKINLPADRYFNNQQKRLWIGEKFENYPLNKSRALIKIQDGCNQFCSYCLVPYLRGRSQSRPFSEIVYQVRQLANHGLSWAVLTGVDIIQYRNGGYDLPKLIDSILSQTKLPLLSFGSISPLIGKPRFLNRFLQLYQKYPSRLAPHLHLSAQSGSDKILRLMRRPYRRRFFLNTVKKSCRAIPNLNISTDIIVGFPGETEKDFQDTLDFARQARFGKIHIFRYSPRPGTLAAKMASRWGPVSEPAKKARAAKLAKLEKKLRRQFWRSQLNRPLPALFFTPHRGQTANFIPVFSRQPQPLDKLVKITAKKIGENYLEI